MGRARLVPGELRLRVRDGVDRPSTTLLSSSDETPVSSDILVDGKESKVGGESEIEGIDSEFRDIESVGVEITGVDSGREGEPVSNEIEMIGMERDTAGALVSRDSGRDESEIDGRSVLSEIEGLESESGSVGRSVLSNKESDVSPVLSESRLSSSGGKLVGAGSDRLGVGTGGRARLKSVGISVERLGASIDGKLRLKLKSVSIESEVLGSDNEVDSGVDKPVKDGVDSG